MKKKSQHTITSFSKSVDRNSTVFILISIVVICISYLFVSSLFYFDDEREMTDTSYKIWDALFSGNIGSYYAYSLSKGHEIVINFLSVVPLAIWLFPVWLVKKVIIGKSVNLLSSASMIYTKLFYVVCLVVLCVFIYKILVHIYKQDTVKALFMAVLAGGSLEFMDSIAYAGQDEVVYLMFYFIGLYYLLGGKRKKALIMHIIAVTLCPIMIIVIMCQYVIYEKNIGKLLLSAVAMVAPMVLFEYIYRNDAINRELYEQNTIGTFQAMMNTGTISTSMGGIPIAFTIIVILAILGYLYKGDDLQKNEKCIQYGAIVMFSICVLSFSLWYRYCLYVPFFVLAIGISDIGINIKTILLSIIGLLRFIYSLVAGCNFQYRFSSSIAVKIFGEKMSRNMWTDECIVDRMGRPFDTMLYIIRPVVMGMAILLIYLIMTKKEEAEFPVSYKKTIVLNSLYGVIFVGYLIFKLITA